MPKYLSDLDVDANVDISGNLAIGGSLTSTGHIKAQNGGNVYVYDDDDDAKIHITASSNAIEGVLKVNNGSNWGLIARGVTNSPRLGAYHDGSLNIYGFGDSSGADHANDDLLAQFDFASEKFLVNGEIEATSLYISGTLNVNSASGDSGQVLTSAGNASPTWTTPTTGTVTGSGAATQVAFWDGTSSLSGDNDLYWDSTNGHLGIGDTSPGSRLKVASGISETSPYTVDIRHVRSNADVVTHAMRIDMDLSGADTTTGDRTNSGLYLDIDSSANGDAEDEHRLYGAMSLVNFTGHSDLVRGGYFLAESNYTGAKTAQLVGVYGQATHDTGLGEGGVSNMYGAYGRSVIENTGDVDYAFGVFGLVSIGDNRVANVGVTKAVEGRITIDKSTTLDYGTMIGISSIIDNNEDTVPNFDSQYLFKGDYQGTRGSAAWGIYTDGDNNYFEGNVGIGTTSPGYKLDVAGPTDSQGFVNDEGGGKNRLLFPKGGSYNGTSSSPITGAIKVTLPTSWTNTMLTITVRIYDYSSGESFDLTVAGYTHITSGQWVNTSAWLSSQSNIDRNFTVRCGHDGTKCCFYIGELTSTWNYLKVNVIDATLNHSNTVADWATTAWSVGIESTAFSSVTNTITNTQANNWKRNGQDLYYGSGSGNVGIGTTSPSQKLEVDGNAIITGDLTALKVRATSAGDASITSTGHAFQAGATSSTNLIIDNNEIMARNNGELSALNLNPDGGTVSFHNNTSSSTIDASGNASFAGGITASATVQAEHLYSTDDLVVDDDATINGDLTVSGITYGLYHATTEDGYYHDDYNGSRNLSMILKNQRADIIRYQPVDNFEYWDGSTWEAAAAQESNVEKLLDGRQDTSWPVPAAYYKFRFTTNASTGWPLKTNIGIQTTWSGSSFEGCQMLVEQYESGAWVLKATMEFGGSDTSLNSNDNGIDNWGLMFKADQALHDGEGSSANTTRITIDFYDWEPSNSSHETIPLQNIFITSNYAGTENTDYTNLLSHDTHLRLGDDRKFIAGAGDDLQIYHDGGNSFINNTGTGALLLKSNGSGVYIKTITGDTQAQFLNDGAVDLYYDNSKKLETTSAGIDVTGEVKGDSLDIDGSADISGTLDVAGDITLGNRFNLGDNGVMTWGNSSDYGQLNWDGDYALISGQSSKGIKFRTNGSNLALTLDTSQNATFAGDVTGVDTLTATTFSGDLNGTINTATTAVTQSASNNSTKVATTAYVDAQVATIVDSAPGTLNTLNELAAALGDDASFSTTVTDSIATKLPLAGGTMSGAIAMGNQNITGAGTITGTTLTGTSLDINGIADITGAAGSADILTLHNTTNGSGCSIKFTDQNTGAQTGTLDFHHSNNAFSQDGGAIFQFLSTEDDLVLSVGTADSTHGRMTVWSGSNNAKPDYAFGQDLDTGMLRTGTNALRLVTGGTAALSIDSSQNATFGGEVEAASLDITGNADISGALTLGTALAVAEGGTGLTSISTLLNSNVTSVSGSSGSCTGNAATATAFSTTLGLTTVSMTFQLTANTWTDTGINSSDLATGTYAMQVYVDDHNAGGGHYDEYYSATISWYGGTTNSTNHDEIVLHRAGHASNTSHLQIRTLRHASSGDNLMLQVKQNFAHNTSLDSADGKTMTFKFRRLI